ncbi:hypothetical protein LguiA_023761 [Lonicera macranthoides]
MSVCRMKSGGGGRKCVRWNPSREQVRVLTELFKCGLRTPTTDQIQKLSSQLSIYGEIESKNVFYWFQNHKARERHKRQPRVSVDEPNNKFLSSTKYFAEVNKVLEPEREIKTLELFPLNSFKESQSENLRFMANERKGNMSFTYNAEGVNMDHPPLDLRLSFL